MLVVPTEKGLLRIMDDFMGSGTASIMVQNQQLRANASPADLLKVWYNLNKSSLTPVCQPFPVKNSQKICPF